MKRALVVRGGWPGHHPVQASDRYAGALRGLGYTVTVSDTLDAYRDPDLARTTDLIVQCWTMGTITAEQLAGLSAAVRAGTGFAGWHGGFVDSFRAEPDYHLITGGQFVHHPKQFVAYEVVPTPGADHPITEDLTPYTVETEQYYVHVDPGVRVLAQTSMLDDPDAPGSAGTVMPVTWVRHWGAGRIFATTLGHEPKDLEMPRTDAMIIRGLTWAAR